MRRRSSGWASVLCSVVLVAVVPDALGAHDGPPFPIVANQVAGPYILSVWTDPDTTDDGTPGGQFWVMPKVAETSATVPATTRATVTITPLDQTGDPQQGTSEPVDGDVGRQFVALLMDHEGRFRVDVVVDGPLGVASVQAEVEGTYDARPAPVMLLVYLAPFVVVGWLWMKAMRRQRLPRSPGPGRH